MAEVEILSRLKHKNIVQILSVIETPKHFWVEMELMNGGTL
jgi:serine/threonine protein kinase